MEYTVQNSCVKCLLTYGQAGYGTTVPIPRPVVLKSALSYVFPDNSEDAARHCLSGSGKKTVYRKYAVRRGQAPG